MDDISADHTFLHYDYYYYSVELVEDEAAGEELTAMLETAGLSEEDTIVTYCTAGIRSAYMQLILEMRGFENSINCWLRRSLRCGSPRCTSSFWNRCGAHLPRRPRPGELEENLVEKLPARR